MSAQRQTIVLTLEDPGTGGEVEHELPTKFEVCGTCQGKGTHVNPAVDGNGLTREDFDADPDFEEGYFAGRYDVQCQTCHGLRVVPVVDEARCKPELLTAYRKQERERAQWAAEERSERRWEAYAMGERD